MSRFFRASCIIGLVFAIPSEGYTAGGARSKSFTPGSAFQTSYGRYPTRNSTAIRLYSTLTEKEIAVLKQYTKDGYLGVNSALRTNSVEGIKETIHLLDSALAKLPNYMGMSLYRGEPAECQEGREYTKGAEYCAKSYTSTSKDMKYPGDIQIEILRHYSGKDIREYSETPEENEVLFPRGTFFRVLEVELQDGIQYVIVEEIAKEVELIE
jgi:hypothetical protein